jgi:hypothetical protein
MGNETGSIKKSALDYIEGWYEASPERMKRALHPDLAKRVVQNVDGEDHLRTTSFERMIELVKSRSADREALNNISCEILDIHGNMACVKTVSPDFVDYLHLAKWQGEWKIINALWEFTPEGIHRIKAARNQK